MELFGRHWASVSVISHKWLETFTGGQAQLDMQIDSLPEGLHSRM